jgi:hypothetical protein
MFLSRFSILVIFGAIFLVIFLWQIRGLSRWDLVGVYA